MRIVFLFVGLWALSDAEADFLSDQPSSMQRLRVKKTSVNAKSSKSQKVTQAPEVTQVVEVSQVVQVTTEQPSVLNEENFGQDESSSREYFAGTQEFLVPLNEFIAQSEKSIKLSRNQRLQTELHMLRNYYNSPELLGQVYSKSNSGFLLIFTENFLSFAARILEMHNRRHEAQLFAQRSELGPAVFKFPSSPRLSRSNASNANMRRQPDDEDEKRQELDKLGEDIARMARKAMRLEKVMTGLEALANETQSSIQSA